MALRTPEEKQPFLRERQQVETVAEGWAYMGYLSAVSLVVVPAVIAVPVGIIAATFAYVFKKRKAACDAVIDDPPRYDFEVATRAQRAWFDPHRLAHVLTPTQVRFAELLAEGDALLRAAVRADERAQGAYLQGRWAFVDLQGRYSDGFFDEFVELQPETARWGQLAAEEVDYHPRLRQLDGQVAPGAHTTLKDVLPAEALAELAAAQISPTALQEIRPPAVARTGRTVRKDLASDLRTFGEGVEERAARLSVTRERRPEPAQRIREMASRKGPGTTAEST